MMCQIHELTLYLLFRLICIYGSIYRASESKNNGNALERTFLSTVAENK